MPLTRIQSAFARLASGLMDSTFEDQREQALPPTPRA